MGVIFTYEYSVIFVYVKQMDVYDKFYTKLEKKLDFNGKISVKVLQDLYKKEIRRKLTDVQIKNIFHGTLNKGT